MGLDAFVRCRCFGGKLKIQSNMEDLYIDDEDHICSKGFLDQKLEELGSDLF